MRGYRLFKNGQEHYTENLSAFCKEHNLQRRHMAEVTSGMRKSYKGWSILPTQAITLMEETADDDGSMTVDEVMNIAEIVARSSGDPAYEKLVMSRVEKIRRGEPLPIKLID